MSRFYAEITRKEEERGYIILEALLWHNGDLQTKRSFINRLGLVVGEPVQRIEKMECQDFFDYLGKAFKAGQLKNLL